MTLNFNKALLKEMLVLFGMLTILIVTEKIGQISLSLPSRQYARVHNSVPKFYAANKDKAMILLKNGEVILFAKPPTDDDVAKAYLNQNRVSANESYKVLYPTNTYSNFWAFHLNATFGFLQIEIDKLGICFVMIVYPIYWIAKGMRWFHKEVTRGWK